MSHTKALGTSTAGDCTLHICDDGAGTETVEVSFQTTIEGGKVHRAALVSILSPAEQTQWVAIKATIEAAAMAAHGYS